MDRVCCDLRALIQDIEKSADVVAKLVSEVVEGDCSDVCTAPYRARTLKAKVKAVQSEFLVVVGRVQDRMARAAIERRANQMVIRLTRDGKTMVSAVIPPGMPTKLNPAMAEGLDIKKNWIPALAERVETAAKKVKPGAPVQWTYTIDIEGQVLTRLVTLVDRGPAFTSLFAYVRTVKPATGSR